MTVQSVELLSRVIKAVCAEFDITIDEISKNKKVTRYASKETVFTSYARTIAMSLLSKHFKQQDVANLMNCTNHSTVSSAKRRAELLVDINPLIRDKFNNITKKLRS
tara:strand:- start:537 stop:857 length:321 start_codon:yes stop_codon:yes gene_type:complete